MTSHTPGGKPGSVEKARTTARSAEATSRKADQGDYLRPHGGHHRYRQHRQPETPQRGGVLERGLLIGGKSVPASSGKLADDVCPWDGQVYARVAAGTPADITRAADAAQAAFPAWSQMGAFERREIFLRAADVMARRGALLGRLGVRLACCRECHT